MSFAGTKLSSKVVRSNDGFHPKITFANIKL